MLDHDKLIRCIKKNSHRLDAPIFNNQDDTLQKLREKLKSHDKLQVTHQVISQNGGYSVLGVDGSQVHPDRSMSRVWCGLVNIGGIALHYSKSSRVEFFSSPEIVFESDCAPFGLSPETIDLMRTARELELACDWALQIQETTGNSPLVLIDGNLLFWFLDSKSDALKSHFFKRYCAALERLAENHIVTASYVSAPRSCDLLTMIWKPYSTGSGRSESIFCDADLLADWLLEFHRTEFFPMTTAMAQEYSPQTRPWFCYFNVGDEIVRIEVLGWMVQNDRENKDSVIECVLSQICDQALKGRGYPVALSEAHERAVIKTSDRLTFFQSLDRLQLGQSISQSGEVFSRSLGSQKALKKRIVAI